MRRTLSRNLDGAADRRDSGLRRAGVSDFFEVKVLDGRICGQKLMFATGEFANGTGVDEVFPRRGWVQQVELRGCETEGGVFEGSVCSDGITGASTRWESEAIIELGMDISVWRYSTNKMNSRCQDKERHSATWCVPQWRHSRAEGWRIRSERIER